MLPSVFQLCSLLSGPHHYFAQPPSDHTWASLHQLEQIIMRANYQKPRLCLADHDASQDAISLALTRVMMWSNVWPYLPTRLPAALSPMLPVLARCQPGNWAPGLKLVAKRDRLGCFKGKRSPAQKLKARKLFVLRRQGVKPKCMLYDSFADKIKTLADYNMLYHSFLFMGSWHCKNTPYKISITALSQKFITSLNRD